jgi:hypothetical protein
MLEKNLQADKKNFGQCDKCKVICFKKEISSIYVQNIYYRNPIKKFDLCIDCYRDFLVDTKRNLYNFERQNDLLRLNY